jgi:6-phosphogluconolactonase
MRVFLLLRALLGLSVGLLPGPSSASTTVYFGNYTSGDGAGIYRADLNEETGELGVPVLAGPAQSPSFLAIHPMMPRLYAVSEVGEGLVTSFAIEADGSLRSMGVQSTRGAGPCHVCVDPSGGAAVVANYGGGSSASYPVLADGSLGPVASFIPHSGSGPNPERQKGPHAHCAMTDPAGHRAFVADLGADRIFIFQLDSGSGEMVPNDPAAVLTPAGGGPRHLAFHPKGKFAYANLEMTSEITHLSYNGETGEMRVLETLSTLPPDFDKPNSTAETLVHPGGDFVYVSNRGHHSIAAFRIGQNGRLSPIGHYPTGGEVPRGFGITPDGRFLVVGNQKSGNVVVLRIHPESGALEPTGFGAKMPSPVCVRFYRK